MRERNPTPDSEPEHVFAKATERYNDIMGEYCAELGRSAAVAQETAMERWQSYVQEVQAAGGGDDAVERIRSAQKKAQEDYVRLKKDYQASARAIQRNFAESLRSLYADYSRSFLGGVIHSLEEMRASLPVSTGSAAGQAVERGKD